MVSIIILGGQHGSEYAPTYKNSCFFINLISPDANNKKTGKNKHNYSNEERVYKVEFSMVRIEIL